MKYTGTDNHSSLYIAILEGKSARIVLKKKKKKIKVI